MTNSNALEKSKGVVIFATNTETIDYVSIAKQSARLAEKYLGLPVTVITTEPSDLTNRRYNVDSDQFETWHNQKRHMAYELSPYDQTILIDSDYFILDDSLLKVLQTVTDYNIIRHNQYLDSNITEPMGKYGLEHVWATVIAFNRTPKSKMLFDFVARIERNYAYYQQLYNIDAANFRNDYAFTIADLVLNGYSQDTSNYIPWPMLSIQNTIDSLELNNDQIYVKSRGKAYVVPKQNLHIMSKAWLTSDACAKFVKDVIGA